MQHINPFTTILKEFVKTLDDTCESQSSYSLISGMKLEYAVVGAYRNFQVFVRESKTTLHSINIMPKDNDFNITIYAEKNAVTLDISQPKNVKAKFVYKANELKDSALMQKLLKLNLQKIFTSHKNGLSLIHYNRKRYYNQQHQTIPSQGVNRELV